MKDLFEKILGRSRNTREKIHDILHRRDLDWSEYRARHGVPHKEDVVGHYLRHWRTCPVRFAGLFDSEYYLMHNPDVASAAINPLVHFIMYGENEGRTSLPGQLEYQVPQASIDSVVVMSVSDTIPAGACVEEAVTETVFDSNEYRALKECTALAWGEYIQQLNLAEGTDPIDHYLRHWKTDVVRFEGLFDSKYYLTHNPDVAVASINPLVHFVTFGESEGRAAWPADSTTKAESDTPQQPPDSTNTPEPQIEHKTASESVPTSPYYHVLKKCGALNWDEYRQRLNLSPDTDPIGHYLKNWKSVHAVFSGFFDSELYLEMYPDIAEHGVNPLVHFVQYGNGEGRIAWMSLDKCATAGLQVYQPDLPTLLVVTHETSATGAPVVALEAARRLGKRYNIIAASRRTGALHDAFLAASVMLIEPIGWHRSLEAKIIFGQLMQRYPIHACITNSVESFNLLSAAAHYGLPTVTLIHEFSEYTRPRGKMGFSLLAADVVIYPAESLKQSGLHALKNDLAVKHVPNHIHVKPQGSMQFSTKTDEDEDAQHILRRRFNIPENAILIAGAGHVQPRKGVDWFAETAYYITRHLNSKARGKRPDVHFVWIGGGFDENDMEVSVWLKTFIDHAGLSERMHFSGHVDSVSSAFRDVDIYLLTSRLDPFPNVAIDALEADCSIGCFAGASGVADFVTEHKARSVVAPYGDCERLARLVVDKLTWLTQRNGVNARLVHEELSIDHYMNVIEDALVEARYRQDDVVGALQKLSTGYPPFDGTFYANNFDKGNPAHHFLALLRKGVVYGKPFPGSGIQHFLDTRPYDNSEPFDEYVETAMSAGSEEEAGKVFLVNGQPAESFKGKIALQFHVYYQDLIPEYSAYFSCLSDHSVDLYVSHVHPINEKYREILESAVSGQVYYTHIPNEGRDVYPFHVTFTSSILDHYDVVGHFHTKKSKDSGEGLGNRWRRYLLANLIGSRQAAAQILGQFNDPEVGLVYAEDHHCVDEASNGIYIEELLRSVGLEPNPPYYHFPLGTMFWARVPALKLLAQLDEETFRLPEPIPYDGSVLHAFERIIPQLVSSAGYVSCRVYTSKTTW
ncbi:MAG: hypothetical protein B7Y40_06945 [Gammaproteobacteria bacterium 28-57-27]|nr:MAG: hypothetical protein B7Y40_06945 [Gammaproteobacteria bacterium 28-57-27]